MKHTKWLWKGPMIWVVLGCSGGNVQTPIPPAGSSSGGGGGDAPIATSAGSGGAGMAGSSSSSGAGGQALAGSGPGAGGVSAAAGTSAGSGNSAGSTAAGGHGASCPPNFDAANPAEHAAPRTETWWPNLHEAQKNRSAQNHVAFVGDSLTQYWTEKAVAQGGSCPQESGEAAWNAHFAAPPRSAGNWGIGGDRTEHILWRIQDGSLDAQKPTLQAVVLMAGTNNVFAGHTAAQIAGGVRAIIEELRCRFAGVAIVLVSIPPLSDAGNDAKVMAANVELAKLASDEGVGFVDVFESLTAGSMRCDGIHLTAAAYAVMASAIEPALTSALKP